VFSILPVGDAAESHAYRDFVPVEFKDNLSSMLAELRAHEVAPVLVTLPTVVSPLMTAEELTERRVFFPYYAGMYSVERFLSLLEAYNRVIRETGRQHGV